ncbi:cytochrome-c peroxidase [Fluviicola taffensis]|uniref:Cytochrome-c peroxidase n=1 Tax=Fluviicola taffensis (strain DSM 16823 / NCIMB 13979 / RW262) TaxID=755732 RepID=F2IAL3_FLUTR|nr:cytochrome c peroxidase [Fluviicola taffensis]AEA43149.1 Cytochrome-c peroxidase [Fluviicola taffensis DSM 16823]
MKVFFFVLSLAAISVLLSVESGGNATTSTIEPKSRYIFEELNLLINELKDFREDIQVSTKREAHYFKVREYYKHIEFFVEHISPIQAKYKINGALVPKFSEYEEGFVVDPCGLQKVEEFLFSGEDFVLADLEKELVQLIEVFQELKNGYANIHLENQIYLEMLQLQLVRIASMNLNGYDATFTKTNLKEIEWNLVSMKQIVRSFESEIGKNKEASKALKSLLKNIQSAQKTLHKNTDFDSFDRLDFIATNLENINLQLVQLHRALGLPWSDHKQALRLNSARLFSPETLNPQFFSIYYTDKSDLEKQAALGKLLFYDPILSVNNQRACSSCHQPDKAFTDGLKTSQAFNNEGVLPRNAPSLINVLYQKAYFYDGKAYQLEQQIRDVVHNEKEMGSKLADVVLKLRLSDEYKSLFKSAFKDQKDAAISEYAISKAISEYEKTLVAMNSRFDRYLAGERTAMNPREINGYSLFAGKALCGSCHFFPLFNGTVPPYFMDSEYEILGTPATNENKSLDPDKGRYLVTKVEKQMYAFKTPTVRNSELTAPYMHNGIYTDLKQVLQFYQKGGGEGLKYSVPNQTLPFDSLQLSDYEQENIILFMKSLTDTVGLFQKPFKLPRFESKPTWNTRAWGGMY